MTTLQPPVFSNIGTPTVVTWDENNTLLGGAIVDSHKAAFATMSGGESVGISVNGGPVLPVNFISTDTTIGDVISRINSVHPGLASILPGGQQYRLSANAISIPVASSDADFDKIGLPRIAKDSAVNARTYFLYDANSDDVSRIDKVSNMVPIPKGANQATLWIEYDLVLTSNRTCNAALGLGWGNSVNSPSKPTTSFLEMYMNSITFEPQSPTFPESTFQSNIGTLFYVPQAIDAALKVIRRAVPVNIPAGADRFFLFGLSSLEDGSNKYPTTAPKITVTATFGARLLKPV